MTGDAQSPAAGSQQSGRRPVANLEKGVGGAGAVYLTLLVEHVLDPWFPRSIDRTYGGFRCDFDRRWRPIGPDAKLLAFQARQTLTAAEALLAFPSNPDLRHAVSAGYQFLRDTMWDREYGGWFQKTDRQGRLLDSGMKHAHGAATAIEACLAVNLATGDSGALELAAKGLDWVDAHAHDNRHGGYFGPLNRDGTFVSFSAARDGVDLIRTPIGLKDIDVNKAFLSACAYACQFGQGQHTGYRARFDELLEIILSRFAAPQSHPYFHYHPDWTPASRYWKPSEGPQVAGILIDARPLVANPQRLDDAALHLLRTAVDHGWSRHVDALLFSRDDPRRDKLHDVYNTPWWAQFELLKAAEYLKTLRPEDSNLEAVVSRARRSAMRYVDKKYSGMTTNRIDARPPADRFLRRRRWRNAAQKGDWWKDASHEGRCLLRLASCGLAEDITRRSDLSQAGREIAGTE
jgi:mannobiose 2-epimerase